MVKSAESKAAEFESNEEFVLAEKSKFGSGKAVESSLKAYYKEFRKVSLNTYYCLICFSSRKSISLPHH